MPERAHVDFVVDQVRRHHAWFDASLPMIASENCLSPLARRLLASDLHDRYAEGLPGKRYYQGCTYIDEIETRCTELAARLFRCSHADVRPVSGTVANMAVFFKLAEPGDTVMAVDTADGGHISHARFGAAGLRGLTIKTYPGFDPATMTLDPAKVARAIRETRPKIALFGQSLFLFPTPLKEGIAAAAHEVGARVMYDGAHVLGLIAGGEFQDPLREGADVITGSTHKTLPGPQGGVVLAEPARGEAGDDLRKRLHAGVFPGVVSSHHLHHMAAKAVAFAEHLEFGRDYARAIIANSKALAQALHERGVKVLAETRGFTASHQVVIDVRAEGGGKWAAKELERANIITNMNLLPGDTKAMDPSGVRLGSQELTRLGMGTREMPEVADLIVRVVKKKSPAEKVAADVGDLRKGFRKVKYCFDEKEAYRFWELV